MLDETIYRKYIFLYSVFRIGNFLCRLKIVAILTLFLHFLLMSRKNYKNTWFEVDETKIGVVLSLPFENAHMHAETLYGLMGS